MRLDVDQAIVRPVEIPPRDILPNNAQLERVEFALRRIQSTRSVFRDDSIWIDEVFDLGRHLQLGARSLGELPQPLQVAVFSIPCDQDY